VIRIETNTVPREERDRITPSIDHVEYRLCPFDFLRLFLTRFLLNAAFIRLVLPFCLTFVSFPNSFRSFYNADIPTNPPGGFLLHNPQSDSVHVWKEKPSYPISEHLE
jgi:hypothetical protein